MLANNETMRVPGPLTILTSHMKKRTPKGNDLPRIIKQDQRPHSLPCPFSREQKWKIGTYSRTEIKLISSALFCKVIQPKEDCNGTRPIPYLLSANQQWHHKKQSLSVNNMALHPYCPGISTLKS